MNNNCQVKESYPCYKEWKETSLHNEVQEASKFSSNKIRRILDRQGMWIREHQHKLKNMKEQENLINRNKQDIHYLKCIINSIRNHQDTQISNFVYVINELNNKLNNIQNEQIQNKNKMDNNFEDKLKKENEIKVLSQFMDHETIIEDKDELVGIISSGYELEILIDEELLQSGGYYDDRYIETISYQDDDVNHMISKPTYDLFENMDDDDNDIWEEINDKTSDLYNDDLEIVLINQRTKLDAITRCTIKRKVYDALKQQKNEQYEVDISLRDFKDLITILDKIKFKGVIKQEMMGETFSISYEDIINYKNDIEIRNINNMPNLDTSNQ